MPCTCERCKTKHILSLLLDASKELSKKREQFEKLFDGEILIFDPTLDKLADVARTLLGVEDDFIIDALYMCFFNYSNGYENNKEKTLKQLLELVV